MAGVRNVVRVDVGYEQVSNQESEVNGAVKTKLNRAVNTRLAKEIAFDVPTGNVVCDQIASSHNDPGVGGASTTEENRELIKFSALQLKSRLEWTSEMLLLKGNIREFALETACLRHRDASQTVLILGDLLLEKIAAKANAGSGYEPSQEPPSVCSLCLKWNRNMMAHSVCHPESEFGRTVPTWCKQKVRVCLECSEKDGRRYKLFAEARHQRPPSRNHGRRIAQYCGAVMLKALMGVDYDSHEGECRQHVQVNTRQTHVWHTWTRILRQMWREESVLPSGVELNMLDDVWTHLFEMQRSTAVLVLGNFFLGVSGDTHFKRKTLRNSLSQQHFEAVKNRWHISVSTRTSRAPIAVQRKQPNFLS